MNTTKVLREQAGIQYQGVTDKSEADPRDGLLNAVVAGFFKRGRFDKPFKVTADNIRSKLGYDPTNKNYVAVEDALIAGAPFIWVVRYPSGPIFPQYTHARINQLFDKEIRFLDQDELDRMAIAKTGVESKVTKDSGYPYFILPSLSKQSVLDILNNIESVKTYYSYMDRTLIEQVQVNAGLGQSFYDINNTNLNATLDFTPYFKQLAEAAKTATAQQIEDYFSISEEFTTYAALPAQLKAVYDETTLIHQSKGAKISFKSLSVETACQMYETTDEVKNQDLPILDLYMDIRINYNDLGGNPSKITMNLNKLISIQQINIKDISANFKLAQYYKSNGKSTFVYVDNIKSLPEELTMLADSGYKSLTSLYMTKWNTIFVQ